MSTKLMHSWLECSSDGSKAQSNNQKKSQFPFEKEKSLKISSDCCSAKNSDCNRTGINPGLLSPNYLYSSPNNRENHCQSFFSFGNNGSESENNKNPSLHSTNRLFDAESLQYLNEDISRYQLNFTAADIMDSIMEEIKYFTMKEMEFKSYDRMVKHIWSKNRDSADGEDSEFIDSSEDPYFNIKSYNQYQNETNHYNKNISRKRSCLSSSNSDYYGSYDESDISSKLKSSKESLSLKFSEKLQEISSEIDEQLETITSQSNCTHSSSIYKSKIQAKDDEICMLKQRLIEKEKECENEKSKNVEKEKQLNELHNIIKNSQKSYQELLSQING